MRKPKELASGTTLRELIATNCFGRFITRRPAGLSSQGISLCGASGPSACSLWLVHFATARPGRPQRAAATRHPPGLHETEDVRCGLADNGLDGRLALQVLLMFTPPRRELDLYFVLRSDELVGNTPGTSRMRAAQYCGALEP